ncbi:MAG: DUF1294 domain-containing protein [Ruminococcaceae bacterium]|nr:DUF1294 domain-containing protein [Oscillospiraceae bacterium]
MVLLKIVAIVLGAISAQTLILYIADKIKAKMGAWRIKEKTLLLFSFFGGGLGGLLGMFLLRHKTRKLYFWAVNIIGFLLQCVLLIYLFIRAKFLI